MTARLSGWRVCAVYGPTISVWGSTAGGGEELLDVLDWLVDFEGDAFGDKYFMGLGHGRQLRQLRRLGRLPYVADTHRFVSGPRTRHPLCFVLGLVHFRTGPVRSHGLPLFTRFFGPSSPLGRFLMLW